MYCNNDDLTNNFESSTISFLYVKFLFYAIQTYFHLKLTFVTFSGIGGCGSQSEELEGHGNCNFGDIISDWSGSIGRCYHHTT